MWWIFLMVVAIWFVIGHIATCISGNVLRSKLMKHFDLSRKDIETIVEAKSYEVTGYMETDSEKARELILNSLFWPHSIYYAVRGYRRIINGGN